MKRTLSWQAWSFFGPIDFVVNFIINVVCPFVFLGFSASIPLFGIPSVAVFLASTCFFVLTIATFFGFRNGVLQIQAKNAEVRSDSPLNWRAAALLRGFSYALLGQCLLWPSLWVLDWLCPELRCSVVVLALVNGLFSGVLAYFTQVNGILQAVRLNVRPAPDRT